MTVRSLKNKLTLTFGAITALAFAVIFFYVVPQLQSNLESQRLRDLSRAAEASSGPLGNVVDQDIDLDALEALVRTVGDNADAEVTVLSSYSSEGRPVLNRVADSLESTQPNEEYSVAGSAASSGRTASGARGEGNGRVAQVARPILVRGRVEWVVLYTRSLEDTSDSVALVRNEVLGAGVVALIVALLGGYLISRSLARRVNRIEEAARDVAAGNFIDPQPIDSSDELGELTRTFNEMQEQLARVDRVRREFIANASHELRTPIFSLGGFAELLEDEELDDGTRRQFVRAMRGQIERLQKLAVDLLDLSKLDAGSIEINPEETDLGELARDVAHEFSPAAIRRGGGLDVRLPEGHVEAWCDPQRVTQIMRILVDNALRHTPEGTPVTVTANRDNGHAEFAVADAGPGVDGESADQLFERFYTADAARGSGLGLAIARELAERMNGEIRLASRPGNTVFTLALPSAVPSDPASTS